MSRTWNDISPPVIQNGANIVIANPNSIAGKTSEITGGRIALSGDAPPGYINPINVRTTMQTMNIDSRFRTNYYNSTSTKFSINLAEPQKKVVGLKLAALEIPLSHYAICASRGNACMLIQTNGDSAGSDIWWRVRLPDGNYENSYTEQSQAFNIELAMNDAISLAEPGILSSELKWTPISTPSVKLIEAVAYSVDHASGRSTFAQAEKLEGADTTSSNQAKGFFFNVDHDGNVDTARNIQQCLGWQLGFRAATYEAELCVSEAPCIITGPRYGFIAINDFQNNSAPTCIVHFADSTMQHNIIGRFGLTNQMADSGIYQLMCDSCISNPTYTVREYFGPTNIQRLEFTLYDDLGNVLDLNGCDWSCLLVFEKQYD
ncbi:MAG: hypothetical protein CMB96_06635 [Flavobacteriaceae bacterium]|nr:hypothetical protein [Flavobacteriaceae bacterium]